MRKKVMLWLVIVMVGILGVGCGEDVFSLERNLYFEIEELNEDGLALIGDISNMWIDGGLVGDAAKQEEFAQRIDAFEKKAGAVKAPKHLKEDLEEWQKENGRLVEFLRGYSEDYNEILEADTDFSRLDRLYERLQSGFKEFEK